MSSEYESALKAIEALCAWYESHSDHRNEATTRLHIIDNLIFECLGWDKRSDCKVEDNYNETYTDYTLMCPRSLVIVEAKKEGIYFDIPEGFSNRDYNIRTLKKDIQPLGKAIEQAATYCQKRGTPFGVVTNGHQLVAFIGSRQDGRAPDEGRAVVFESLEAMVNDFRTLWKLLSKSGVIERHLLSRLTSDDQIVLPRKLSQIIAGFPGSKTRNIIQTDLQIMAEVVFEDIIGSQELEKEFLDRCYCQSGALSQYALVSKSLLSQRYASLFGPQDDGPSILPATTKKGTNRDIISESFSKRPILILGDVGVGKTIFLRHFIFVEAQDLFDNAIVLYLDFGCKAALAKDLREFIVDEFQRQLNEKCEVDIFDSSFVRAVYHGELLRFDKGIYGSIKETNPQKYELSVIELLETKIKNSERYLQDSLEHITKGRKQQVVIFLDNADQRSDEIQQELFVIAVSMAANWPATVFLALRPETFQRSKRYGTLSAYHLKAFGISPPRIDQVLDKRLVFGQQIARGEIPSSILPQKTNIDLKKVESFLNIVKFSIDQSQEIVECVDNLSWGNVRLALDSIRTFIGSGHIDTEKILDIYDRNGWYLVRLHEFLRSIIYGDSNYYDSENSPIYNLYDLKTKDCREHFLGLLLLSHIRRMGQQSSQQGFVGIEEIYDYAQGLGFLFDQIDNQVARLWKKRLLETAGRVKPVDRDIALSAMRITTIGAYHLLRLPKMFVYYDAVVIDTPILDSHYRERILNVSDIRDRLERGSIFIEYLKKCLDRLDNRALDGELKAQLNEAKEDIEMIVNFLS